MLDVKRNPKLQEKENINKCACKRDVRKDVPFRFCQFTEKREEEGRKKGSLQEITRNRYTNLYYCLTIKLRFSLTNMCKNDIIEKG